MEKFLTSGRTAKLTESSAETLEVLITTSSLYPSDRNQTLWWSRQQRGQTANFWTCLTGPRLIRWTTSLRRRLSLDWVRVCWRRSLLYSGIWVEWSHACAVVVQRQFSALLAKGAAASLIPRNYVLLDFPMKDKVEREAIASSKKSRDHPVRALQQAWGKPLKSMPVALLHPMFVQDCVCWRLSFRTKFLSLMLKCMVNCFKKSWCHFIEKFGSYYGVNMYQDLAALQC